MNSQIHRTTFKRLSQIIEHESGISLSSEKQTLLMNRITTRLRELHFENAEEYLQFIELQDKADEIVELLNAISTNTTRFYREQMHFSILEKLATEWKNEKRNNLKIWSAACSSGEEPYTIGAVVDAVYPLAINNIRILATDISVPELQKGVQGRYPHSDIQALPYSLQARYFSQKNPEGICEVTSELKQSILFKRLNLSKFPYPLRGPIDAIFCRNVMIYFNLDLRQKMVSAFEALLRPGGYLFVGLSENLLEINHSLERVDVSTFRKKR